MRYVTVVPLLVATTILFCSSAYPGEVQTLYNTADKITIKGILKSKQFKDANGQPEDAYILHLKKPIDVARDESGGPENNVKEIQLAILYKQYGKADSCMDKEINADGYLYYPFDAHHHTSVLMRVVGFSCLKDRKNRLRER